MIGCSRDWLNLAFQQWIDDNTDVTNALNTVHEIRTQLRPIKNAARLRELNHLGATSPMETRWMGIFEIVRRYFRIKESIRQIEDLESLFPTARFRRTILGILPHFNRFHSITLNL